MGKYALKNPESRMVLAGGRVITSADILTQEEFAGIVNYLGYDEKQKPVTLTNEALAAQFKELPEEKEEKKKQGQANA